jgi:deoxyribonuclease V
VARAVIVVMRGLQVVEQAVVDGPVPIPYIPGLLSFREIPPLLSAWKKLKTLPDVVIVDGQGIAHPRRLGIASHLGLVLGIPTIGCAKSRLCGVHDEPPARRGAWTPLTHQGETVGAALRTRAGCNVVYVSTGHRISLECSISVVLGCAPRYRLPEPQRLADQLTKQ